MYERFKQKRETWVQVFTSLTQNSELDSNQGNKKRKRIEKSQNCDSYKNRENQLLHCNTQALGIARSVPGVNSGSQSQLRAQKGTIKKEI